MDIALQRHKLHFLAYIKYAPYQKMFKIKAKDVNEIIFYIT
jgi:hypothetical protein